MFEATKFVVFCYTAIDNWGNNFPLCFFQKIGTCWHRLTWHLVVPWELKSLEISTELSDILSIFPIHSFTSKCWKLETSSRLIFQMPVSLLYRLLQVSLFCPCVLDLVDDLNFYLTCTVDPLVQLSSPAPAQLNHKNGKPKGFMIIPHHCINDHHCKKLHRHSDQHLWNIRISMKILLLHHKLFQSI